MSLSNIQSKIRYQVDATKSATKTFTYEGSSLIFTLPKSNAQSVTKIEVNGAVTSSSNYSFSSPTVTFNASVLTSGDSVVVYYTYYDYSSSELNGYIVNALIELSVNKYKKNGELFRVDSLSSPTIIYPSPNEGEENLIAFVAGILIKPEYSAYNLPSLSVRYPKEEERDVKIRKLIDRFDTSLGITGAFEV